MSSAQMWVAGREAVAPEPEARAVTRRLRVLTITPFYPSAEDSSQGGFVAEPLAWMSAGEVANYVIAVQPLYRERLHAVNSGVGVNWKQYFSVPGNLGLPAAGAFLAAGLTSDVLKMHRAEPFDLIHAHGALPCGHAARLIGRKIGVPFVVSVHGLDVFSEIQTGRAVGSWCRRISETVYRSAQAVVCISQKVRQGLGESLSGKSKVIYNGVDAGMFRPGPELKTPITLLSVGNLIPIKGHALLLRGFARVSEVVPDCSLEIFGEGAERDRLMQLARELGVSARVHFRGRQSRESIADAMRRCSVFVLPSAYEGLGCVYLEAMASARSVIGCRGQGIEEIVEHGKHGFLISPGSEGELSEYLKVLLQNGDLRRKMGANARDLILGRHTIGEQARQLTAVYRECAL